MKKSEIRTKTLKGEFILFRHKKSNIVYKVIAVGTSQDKKGKWKDNIIIYINVDFSNTKYFIRKYKEFVKKFKLV